MAENAYRETIQQPSDRIIVALDNMDWDQANSLMGSIGQNVGMAKANSLAQVRGWAHAVNELAKMGTGTMADTKFHDIPETVRLQVQAVAECEAQLITVHASGGLAMLQAAVRGRDEGREKAFEYHDTVNPHVRKRKEKVGGILGITVLTSLGEEEGVSIYGDTPEKKVVQFAHMALEAGVDGIVCSGKELRAIRAISALDLLVVVVPGITPKWAQKAGDQKRVVTPTEALQQGADFIVVGRAITQPPEGISSGEAAYRIAEELKEAA